MKTLADRMTLWVALLLALAPVALRAQAVPEPVGEHRELTRFVGEWTATIRMGGQESKGTFVARAVCGGLWIATEFRGEFGGTTYEGRGLDGYDPDRGKFTRVWVDSMNYRPVSWEGDFDRGTQTLTLHGEGTGPDGTPLNYRSVTRFRDRDHHTFTLHLVSGDGREVEALRIEYTRRK